jgi:hypothetical protein
MFTRKHFEAIAAAIRPLTDSAVSQVELDVLKKTAIAMCVEFAGKSTSFRADLFLRACGF